MCNYLPSKCLIISIHALVKRATHLSVYQTLINFYFNPRPRKEGDSVKHHLSIPCNYFNPRPRKEGDKAFSTVIVNGTISIHALVKRATIRQQIHRKAWIYFNPRPRKEGDEGYSAFMLPSMNFNPRPRKEGDFAFMSAFPTHGVISIHALVKRATSNLGYLVTCEIFQSTPS